MNVSSRIAIEVIGRDFFIAGRNVGHSIRSTRRGSAPQFSGLPRGWIGFNRSPAGTNIGFSEAAHSCMTRSPSFPDIFGRFRREICILYATYLISIHDSELTRIKSKVFWGYASLKSISIPRRVQILCSECFSNCYSLSSISFEIDSELTRIESKAFHVVVLSNQSQFLRMLNLSMVLHFQSFKYCDLN
jgi:hypothetical protein